MAVKFFKFILILILLSISFIMGSYFYVKSYLQESIQTPKIIFIPKGSTKSALKSLKDSGIDIGEYDYYLVKLIGYPQAGWINLEKESMTRSHFFQRITHSKAAVKDITLIPGETKELFFEDISKKMDLNQTLLLKEYYKSAPSADGVILADTYNFPIGISEKELIKFLIEKSLNKHKKISTDLLGKYNQKLWFEKEITIASIITKEAADIDEMPLVSAVIHNRLKKGMPLQMDGTLNYKYQSHKKVTPQMIRQDSSVYNTYKNSGLIPHPICAVTYEAISAAINPADVNYLYFVRSKNGKHSFTNSYKKHLLNINKVKSVNK